MHRQNHGYWKIIKKRDVSFIYVPNDINDKSSRCSLAFHLSFIVNMQVTVFCTSDVCGAGASDEMRVRSSSEGGFYSSQATQKLLEIPTTASAIADWPLCGLHMSPYSGWICACQSCVLCRCLQLVFLSQCYRIVRQTDHRTLQNIDSS